MFAPFSTSESSFICCVFSSELSFLPSVAQVYMFCGEIAALISVDVELGTTGQELGRSHGEVEEGEDGGKGEGGGGRRRVSREDFLDGGVVGLDGFCLRRCAISSQWLNRSFASPSFLTSSSSSSATLSSSSSFGVSHVTSLSSHSRVSFNALSSLSLAVPDGDAVLSSVTSDLCAKISFRCHAFALRLEVSVVLHFLGCHAFARMALPFFFTFLSFRKSIHLVIEKR